MISIADQILVKLTKEEIIERYKTLLASAAEEKAKYDASTASLKAKVQDKQKVISGIISDNNKVISLEKEVKRLQQELKSANKKAFSKQVTIKKDIEKSEKEILEKEIERLKNLNTTLNLNQFTRKEMIALDSHRELDFLVLRIREHFGNKALADLLMDERNPRSFTQKDYDGVINGAKSKDFQYTTSRYNTGERIITPFEPPKAEDQVTLGDLESKNPSIEDRLCAIEERLAKLEEVPTANSKKTDQDCISIVAKHASNLKNGFRSSDITKLALKEDMFYIDPRKVTYCLKKLNYSCTPNKYINEWRK